MIFFLSWRHKILQFKQFNHKVNHFYVHPNDGPNLVTVLAKLNDNNYSTWRRSMCIALRAMNKIPIIDGPCQFLNLMISIKHYEKDATIWYILASLTQFLLQLLKPFISMEIPFDVCNDLKERFSILTMFM